MKKYILETQNIILKIYVTNFPIYIIKFMVNFKYKSSYRWCSLNNFFKKVRNIHSKTSVLESLLNKFICLQACNFARERLRHGCFPVNIANFKDTYFEKHMRTAGFDSSYMMHRKSNKIIPEADWPSRLAFYFFQIIKSLCFSYSRSYYCVVSLVAIRCHSLSFFDTRHFLSLAVPLVVTRCITHCYSL